MSPFSPGAATVNIDVSNTNQRVALSDRARGAISVRVMNNGTATAWIAFGDVTVAAAVATSMPVGPGASATFALNCPFNDVLYAAAIAAASTGKIYFTPGAGGA